MQLQFTLLNQPFPVHTFLRVELVYTHCTCLRNLRRIAVACARDRRLRARDQRRRRRCRTSVMPDLSSRAVLGPSINPAANNNKERCPPYCLLTTSIGETYLEVHGYQRHCTRPIFGMPAASRPSLFCVQF